MGVQDADGALDDEAVEVIGPQIGREGLAEAVEEVEDPGLLELDLLSRAPGLAQKPAQRAVAKEEGRANYRAARREEGATHPMSRKLLCAMQVLLQIFEHVLELGQVLMVGFDERLVGIEHGLGLGGAIRGGGGREGIAKGRTALFGAAGIHREKLVEAEVGEQIVVALVEIGDVEAAVAISRRRREIMASVPMKVESITGQLRRSTTNSRWPRLTISLANSFTPALLRNEPLPSTLIQTILLEVVPTRMV